MTNHGNEEGAVEIGNEKYRYRLVRRTGWNASQVNFVMLNPSTATADRDDSTVRRCIGYASMWGYGWLAVTNLSPLRATFPADLRTAGPEPQDVAEINHAEIMDTALNSDLVVFGWGFLGYLEGRAGWVIEGLRRLGIGGFCLGVTQSGQPRHPLYVPRDHPLVKYL